MNKNRGAQNQFLWSTVSFLLCAAMFAGPATSAQADEKATTITITMDANASSAVSGDYHSYFKTLMLLAAQSDQKNTLPILGAAFVAITISQALFWPLIILTGLFGLRYLVFEGRETLIAWETQDQRKERFEQEKKRLEAETEQVKQRTTQEKKKLEAETAEIMERTSLEKKKFDAESAEITERTSLLKRKCEVEIEQIKATGEEQRKKLIAETDQIKTNIASISQKTEADIANSKFVVRQKLANALVPQIADPVKKTVAIEKIVDELVLKP